jgi:hypothetical protein
MKRSLITLLFLLGAAITAAQALSASPLVAQAGSEPTKTAPAAPAEQQSSPAPAGTATASEPAAPAPAPAPVKAEQTAAIKSEKQSHTEYSGMEIKECSGCHTGSGVAPNHGAGWSGEHRKLAMNPEKNCADCHKQQFCLDCHTGGGIDADLKVANAKMNYVPHSHRTDFRELHP